VSARGRWLFLAGTLALLIPAALEVPRPSEAMPPFAQAYGLKCSTCHTMVPLLNAYGRYIQRTGYASLDRSVLARAVPLWIGESLNYNSTAGAGTGTPRYSFGNLALHGVGYIAPDITFHAQQWITAGDQSGFVDTLWVTYNNILHRDGHLFVGKLLNPAPSAYSQTSDLDPAAASNTVVGEHDWAATYGNRWGTKLVYVHHAVTAEAGYFLSSDDLNGITDFSPGDKTFQWKVAIAKPTQPLEYGVFGSKGSIPVSTLNHIDHYNSVAGYVQLDPDSNGRPGLLAIYSSGFDDNPGAGAAGTPIPATGSRGASLEVYEPVLAGNVLVSLRHDFNDAGAASSVTNGNSVNLAFNVPRFTYLHGYLETNMGGSSSLAGASGGPTWKGMLWLTVPVSNVK